MVRVHPRLERGCILSGEACAEGIGGGRVGPGRAMPDQKYGPEIINDAILITIIINNQLIISY